MNLAEMPNN